MVRATADEIELSGHIIPAQTLLILSTISALRDETVYKHPDTFDIHRNDLLRDHLAFGAGAHRCVADHLARIELEECLSVFTRRLPKLRLEDIPVSTAISSFACRAISVSAGPSENHPKIVGARRLRANESIGCTNAGAVPQGWAGRIGASALSPPRRQAGQD